MCQFLPLSRKYRPKKFSDVIGQDVTVSILSQGILKNRITSAVLFTGIRGTGKTTLARILARVFRCENNEGKIDACGVCESCLNFEKNAIDVIEMDAASHTGVDDIREIIESCKYAPTTGKWKIYIIDEVHMLSKSAFNALLKTLEEPPAHVKFIFATTELYKVPDTVVSRCLLFNLKKVDVNLLAQYLSGICLKENVQFDESALFAIARAASGSVRDGLSILDQAINISSDEKITEEHVRKMLCDFSYTDALNVLKLIFQSDYKKAIMEIRKSIISGTSYRSIIRTFLELVHKITCMKIGANYFGNCHLSHDEELDLNTNFSNVDMMQLTTVWQILSKENEISYDEDLENIAIELLVIRLCCSNTLKNINQRISDLDTLTESVKQDVSRKADVTQAVVKKTLTEDALSMFSGAFVVED